jgi:hypothetical protein
LGPTYSTDATLSQKNIYFIYARGFGITPTDTVTLETVDEF